MARYTEAVCRLCRRENQKLFLKGDRCYSAKCPVVKRGTVPGQHAKSRRKTSEYGLQLREKQKARRTYGLLEKQFHSYFTKATNMKGAAGENMLQLLERRLDNVVYRLGFASTRREARQLVNHGHFTVNGKRCNIPSAQVKVGDVIAVCQKSQSSVKFKTLIEEYGKKSVPQWMLRMADSFEGKIIAMPAREDIDFEVSENLIVELYSR